MLLPRSSPFQHVFDELDLDHDGRVSCQDFVTIIVSLSQGTLPDYANTSVVTALQIIYCHPDMFFP
eukprot:501859-Pelagomonas_calceolata.AAC.3